MSQRAIERFIELANEVIAELEQAISKHGPNSPDYPNADVALRNVTEWRDLAAEGRIAGSYFPNFGISKSDLMFGRVEQRMYQLERLYVAEIRDSGQNS